jgi:hypothetical protein
MMLCWLRVEACPFMGPLYEYGNGWVESVGQQGVLPTKKFPCQNCWAGQRALPGAKIVEPVQVVFKDGIRNTILAT